MTPYMDDNFNLYWDVVAIVWNHYMDPPGVDGLVRTIADRVERDGNVERADWFRRLVAGEEVER